MSAPASPVLVLVAASGRSLRLDVHAGVRVDAVQQALLSFTCIPLNDQLVMYNGSRLDPSRTLGSYGLPVDDAGSAEESPVFLYCRSFLKPGAKVPECEVLPDIIAAVPAAPSVLQLHHPLQSSPSPLVRGLPATELQFQHDLAVAKAYWDASQLRVQRCRQLLSEQEVQARAADAARANVEVHFNHISVTYHTFLSKFSSQHAAHGELLGSFESDLAQLTNIQLHPGLQQRSSWRTLEDLTPMSKMQQWGDHCQRSHEHFGLKVSELGALLQTLKQDVELLLVQTPTVDLDQLGNELSRAEEAADELSLVVQTMAKDLRAVRELVEQAVADLADPSGAGTRVQDSSSAMQSIVEAHVSQLLPEARALDQRTSLFCARCAQSKRDMTADVVLQLQRISGQQSRIRDMKSKLAAFSEVLTRQEVAFAELKMANKIPTAYRMLLAECMRRQAWQDLLSQQAARWEEHQAKLRAKEGQRRAAFLQQVERYLPNEAVAKAGLMHDPSSSNCADPPPEHPLLPVTAAELQWLPVKASALKSFMGHAAAPPSTKDMAAEMAFKPSQTTPLEMENARLKSELASYIAAACIRELAASEAAGGPAPHSPQGGGAGSRPGLASEEVVEPLKRALCLKEELLEKLQAEVRSLAGRCAAQHDQLQCLEAEKVEAGRRLAAALQQQEVQQQQGQGGQQVQRRQSACEPPGSSSCSALAQDCAPGPCLLQPQPLLLGPIALAALSTCRPGSAGPPTIRSGLPALPPPPKRSSMAAATPDRDSMALEASRLPALTAFASAPLGVPSPLQQQQQREEAQEQHATAAAAAAAAAQQQEQQEELQQQEEQEQEQDSRMHATESTDYGMIGGTFSMYESEPPGAVDEGPAAAPARVPSSLTLQAAVDGPAHLDPSAPFGSLPFASSLPRYSSMTHIPLALAQGLRRPSADADALALPNAVLASVMRAAGEEPDPLPWVVMRQAPIAAAAAAAAGSAPQPQGGAAMELSKSEAAPPHGMAAPVEDKAGADAVAVAGAEGAGTQTSAEGGEGDGCAEQQQPADDADLPDEEAPDLDDIMADEQPPRPGPVGSSYLSVCE